MNNKYNELIIFNILNIVIIIFEYGYKLYIRNLEEKDYNMLVTWWIDNRFPVVPRDILPNNISDGLVVYYDGTPVCAGFLYATSSSSLFWLEWIISSYSVKNKVRSISLSYLVNGLKYMAKKMNAKVIYTSVMSLILRKMLDNGFVLDLKTLAKSYVSCKFTLIQGN